MLYASEKNSKIKIRLLTIFQLFEGKASIEISIVLKQSDVIIRNAIHRYNKFVLIILYLQLRIQLIVFNTNCNIYTYQCQHKYYIYTYQFEYKACIL